MKNPATVHEFGISYNDSDSGPSRTVAIRHWCQECSAKRGLTAPSKPAAYPSVVGMLGKALLGMESQLQGHQDEALQKDSGLQCPTCGWTEQDFRQTTRFGCPDDYEVFKDILDDVLERIHGTDQHLVDARETELVRLNEEMAEAISKENYEVAGELKLRIQELESSLEGSDSLDF